MIVVDTSVWIDFLNFKDTPRARRCAQLVEDGAPLALTDVIITEILQGLRSDREASDVGGYLRHFPIVSLHSPDDFEFAAALYRQARKAGITIGSSVDCLIGAACIRANAPLLHDDQDFDRLASCTELRIFE